MYIPRTAFMREDSVTDLPVPPCHGNSEQAQLPGTNIILHSRASPLATYRSMMSREYKYHPLAHTRSTRLLQVTGVETETIHCSLRVVDLDNPPLYQALSYTWGDPFYNARTQEKPSFPIDCDGQVIEITANLQDALFHLFTSTCEPNITPRLSKDNFLWVDAICINQTDDDERGSQVAIMAQIYQRAQSVIIWLGKQDDHSRDAQSVLSTLASLTEEQAKSVTSYTLENEKSYTTLGIGTIEKREWLDLVALMQRSWFTRAWTTQEAVAAKEIIVLCGHQNIPWSMFVAASTFLKLSRWYLPLTVLAVSETSLKESKEATLPPQTIVGLHPQILEDLRNGSVPTDFDIMLGISRHLSAKDARDHVFAVLGMCDPKPTSANADLTIIPNYNKIVSEVFLDAAWKLIREHDDLYILSLVEDRFSPQTNILPSWVPDWSATLTPIPIGGYNKPRRRWCASKGIEWLQPIATPREQLSIQGFCFDKIVEKAATLREVGDFHQIVTVLALTNRLECSLYPTGISKTEALWRSLIADTYCSAPAGPQTRYAFCSFLAFCLWRLEDAALGTQGFDPKGAGFGPNDPSLFDHNELQNMHKATYIALEELASSDTSGNIPDASALAAALDVLKRPPNAAQENMIEGCNKYIGSMSEAYGARRVFRTAENFLGIASHSLLPDDEIWIAAGAAAPIILRPAEQERFTLVGEAYVHGIMIGEATLTTKAQMIRKIIIE